MKILILTTLIQLLCFNLHAQESRFEQGIIKGKEMIKQSDTVSQFQRAANYFERIAQAEPQEWLPLYYKAQAFAFAGNQLIGEEKENYFMQALEVLDQADLINKNAELITLRGFVQMLRLSADPATHGQSLSPIIFGLFQKALNLEPKNPRALLFLGQMEYGTAQFFGSSTDKGCGYITKANELFMSMSEKETIYPTWGTGSAASSANRCNQ